MKQTTPFAKLVLLLALVGALALAGCGGDDGLSAADQARIEQAEADKAAAEQKAAEEEAARLEAEQKAAEEEAARLEAEQKAAEEEAARLEAEQKAAEEEAARLEAEQKAAEEKAADEAERERLAAISAAQGVLSSAEMALAALAADATDEAKRDAYRMVESAANALRDVLQMNAGTTAEIEAAIRKSQAAKIAADDLQGMITAAANAAEQSRLMAISTAQGALSDAEGALMELAEDATDEAKRDAQRAVESAAAALIQALMDNGGTEDQIAAATMKRDSAKMMADDLQGTITAQAEADARRQMIAGQRSAIANAIAAAMTAVSAVDDDATDAEVMAADDAITTATTAIAAATGIPETEKSANTGTVSALMARLSSAKTSRQMAMDDAAEEQRMANIATARGMLTASEDALAALADDATDEQKRDAYRMVEAAANALYDALQMNGGSASDIQDAIRKAQTAKIQADGLQATITAKANTAEQLRLMAIRTAQGALSDAEDALTELAEDASDKERRDAYRAVESAADALLQALTDNDGTDDQIMAATTRRDSAKMAADALTSPIEVANQRSAIMDALADALAAVAAVGNTSPNAEVKAAEDAIEDARQAIADATELSEAETTAYGITADAHAATLDTAKKNRMAAIEEAEKTDNAAMAVTAARLYEGIGAPTLVTLDADTRRHATYNTGATAIEVTSRAGTADDIAVTLSEDKKTMVADNHGWEGKKYTAEPNDDGMYEAIVYSNVEAPAMGKKFGSATALPADAAELAAFAYQYALVNGALVIDTSQAGVPARVALDISRTAGTQAFELPNDNTVRVVVSGSYHGVPGTYECAPDTAGCSATVQGEGWTLAGADSAGWMFTPSDPNARVMELPDADYASYGWWLHKSENGNTFTASAFVDVKGTIPAISNLDALNGKARYVGGAAGKYAISSPAATGGTNDAGHFTATATLEANFTTNDGTDTSTNAITGTIDQFNGADGEPRDWSVKLNGSPIANAGGIGEAGDATAGNAATVWTIGGAAADAAGEWTGNLRNSGDDGVPQVATGTFYSEYEEAGRMVGAFGANEQQ